MLPSRDSSRTGVKAEENICEVCGTCEMMSNRLFWEGLPVARAAVHKYFAVTRCLHMAEPRAKEIP